MCLKTYLGLCISIRPLNIDGPSNVLNCERHSEAAVDVSALSLFLEKEENRTTQKYKEVIE